MFFFENEKPTADEELTTPCYPCRRYSRTDQHFERYGHWSEEDLIREGKERRTPGFNFTHAIMSFPEFEGIVSTKALRIVEDWMQDRDMTWVDSFGFKDEDDGPAAFVRMWRRCAVRSGKTP